MSNEGQNRVVFTKKMRREYTILIPTMLPLHFELFANVFRNKGYKVHLLDVSDRNISEVGVKYVHNDACYPAILVIGQLIDALQSGEFDVDKTALMIMQTGGGCRASNYISLLRKALVRSGFPQVPVVSLNVAGLEKNPGFKITVPMFRSLAIAALYADLLMLLKNQCRIREVHEGETDKVTKKWLRVAKSQLSRLTPVPYVSVKKTMALIVKDFDAIERHEDAVTRVGIVGEIYVKYSPLGNNELEKFLFNEGAEAVVPGLLDFCFYCVYNNVLDNKLYHMHPGTVGIWKWVSKYITNKKDDMIAAVKENSNFITTSSYGRLVELAQHHSCVGIGMKMGEGWLLTAEMLELCEMGVKNIVCTQPFGCLPNHIVGKGMMRPIKEMHPDANIVAIDYDPGASRINQENRLKLMLSNAKK